MNYYLSRDWLILLGNRHDFTVLLSNKNNYIGRQIINS